MEEMEYTYLHTCKPCKASQLPRFGLQIKGDDQKGSYSEANSHQHKVNKKGFFNDQNFLKMESTRNCTGKSVKDL